MDPRQEQRKNRLLELIEKETGGNKNLFAKALGYKNSSIINNVLAGRNDISHKLGLKICNKFLCDYEWLMYGVFNLTQNELKKSYEEVEEEIEKKYGSEELSEADAEQTINNLVVHEKELEKYILFRTWKERLQMQAKNEALLEYLRTRK